MIQAFSIKYQKHVAAFFLYILVTELCLPLASGAGGYYTRGTGTYTTGINSAPPFITGFNSAMPVPGLKGNGLLTKIQLPAEQKPVKKTIPVFNNKTFNSSGPSQPEMQSFQSVNTNNMVDLFTGDFSYNIPLLDAGGYPVNIHYRSGISMDQEASWVGLGWNINPGTISRNMRGVPDDFSGEKIEKTFSIRPNWTAGVNAGANPEIFGKEAHILGANAGIFYNNYKGIGLEAGISVSLLSGKGSKLPLTADLGLGNNSQSGVTITPSFGIKVLNVDRDGVFGSITGGFSASAAISTRSGLQSLSITGNGRRAYGYWADNGRGQMESQVAFATASQSFSPITFSHHAYTPTINLPYTSYDYSFSLKGGGELFGVHPLGSLSIYYSSQSIETKSMSLSAYGYLNLQKGSADEAALLDFNREKELTYHESPATPHLAIPNYTYDVYAISGEGTGGMFRPYRGDIGFVRDHIMQTKSTTAGGGLELGAGNAWHGGADARFIYTSSVSSGWTDNNELARQIGFKEADSTFENVYFKNPSEKTINTQGFYNSVGDTYAIAPVMSNNNDPSLTPMVQPYKDYSKSGSLIQFNASSTVKKSRDKRSQVISYLNADLASLSGLDKTINDYPVNKYFIGNCDLVQCDNNNPSNCSSVVSIERNTGIRHPNHLSEITVLNADGRRYVYGLPVYNVEQDDVTFSVYKSNADINTSLVGYTPGSENSTDNKAGKDNYYNSEKIPPYAHSFLLTAVVSPDYVDRLQDGITDDDQGDAVKFDYSRLYDETHPYQWRVPFDKNKAQYNEGLKTDESDDKGNYTYGKKEIWYLNSIQSKTMVATFTLNDPAKGEVRQDGYGVMNENGGINTNASLRYLKEINLYSKSDYLQNRGNATPVKTVHFAYSYRLCTGAPGSLNGQGKLTLDSIWFTYNGNDKGKLNPYVFNYHTNNPSYNIKSYDRWGNYKSAADNPAQLPNADYPYALQNGINEWDSTKAAVNAGAWNLTNIQLPSGGKMQVDYESDDYAYVQNVRAGQMMQLAGFGSSNNFADANSDMYISAPNSNDKAFVFIRVPVTPADGPDAYKKYLQGINKLYFNYRVQMPSDVYGSGYEHVSTYARFDDYGVVPGNNNVIWIHLQSSGGLFFESPLAATAIQALKLNLPSKAYPHSDLNGAADPVALGKSLIAFLVNFSELLSNFSMRSRILSWARTVDLDRSFVRLNNPDYKKLGGGLRVKRITISDNWNAMTGQKESTYGQEYDYSTVNEIDGKPTRISSGVASYEPLIGNEENPLRQPIEYGVQVAPLGPTQNYYSETPLGEGYYPSASVGYSKVRVHTIHKDVQSANGYEETEFYTTYDFPTITDHTPVEEHKLKPSVLGQLFRINTKRYLTQTQGFKVELNDMNGKERMTASYPENDPYNALEYTKYYYKVDDENAAPKHLSNMVPVVDSATGHINPAAPVGKDVEIMVDLREQDSQTKGGALEFNMDGFILGIFPLSIPSLWPVPQFEEDRYRSAAIMKLVQRYGIIDKVVHYEKGSLVTTQNELYDAETGDVLLTKTQNEFNDPVYNFSYPAHWAYSGMGPAYKNISAVFSGLQFTDGKITGAPSKYGNIERFFESGDEVMVWANDKISSNASDISCSGEDACIQPNFRGYTMPQKLWAVDASKIQNTNTHIAPGIYFIDTLGNFFNSKDATGSLQIIRSGKRNMAATAVGAVTSLASPLRQVNGKWKLVFDDATKVVNAAASAYKDFWAVEDAKFELKTVVVSKQGAVQTKTFIPDNTLSMYDYIPPGGANNITVSNNPDFFGASTWFHHQGGGAQDGQVDSWIRFNLGEIPSNAHIISASLVLMPHNGNHNVGSIYNSDWDIHNHGQSDPHNYNDDKGNEAILSYETGSVLNNNLDWSNLGTDNSLATQVFLNNLSTVRAVIPGTVKQNSYLADVTNIVGAMVAGSSQRSIFRITPAHTWRIDGHNDGRLCFWSKDNCQDPAYTQITNPNLSPHVGGAVSAKEFVLDNSAINPACLTAPRLKVTFASCQNGDELIQQCDTFYCIKRVPTDTCLSYITDTSVNPYRFGILGNWRMNKGYTYYNTRKEVNPLTQTDIRKNGVVTDFHPYWAFGTSAISPSTDTVRWVWNSELTLFNRKGFEIENKDPLGRYNSAQYGYKQTLPVAVTQNAHYREQAFDGFEDYGYDNDLCANTCPLPRHLDFNNISAKLTGAEAHTGKYSLMLNAGNAVNADIQVADTLQQSPELYFKIDTTIIPRLQFSDGYGMKATYYGGYHYETDNDGLDNFNITQGSIDPVVYHKRNVFYSIEYPFHDLPHVYMQRYEENNIVAIPNAQYYKVVWEGTMVARETNDYIFQVKADNAIKVWIGGKLVVNAYPNDPVYYGGENTLFSEPMKFIRGKIYNVRVEHLNGTSSGYAYLYWHTTSESYNAFVPIPINQLFESTGDAVASISSKDTTCLNWQGIRSLSKDILIKEFSPVKSTKFLVGAWVKEDKDCHCQNYQDAAIEVSFFNSYDNLISTSLLKPSGNIIEGWQRIEDYVTIPTGTVKMRVSLKSTPQNNYNGKVYFDDLRIHPFNANMKSYVYDPISLRLMADLDENNYASFYEYDDDGTLIRVKKETERGIKTIKESRSALLKP